MPLLHAGELTRRVTIQQPGPRLDDNYGGGSSPYVAVVSRRAKIEPLAGQERFINGQFDPSLTDRVTIRYYAGIRPSWRILYGTRVFDIKYVADPDEAHREIVLMCTELPPP